MKECLYDRFFERRSFLAGGDFAIKLFFWIAQCLARGSDAFDLPVFVLVCHRDSAGDGNFSSHVDSRKLGIDVSPGSPHPFPWLLGYSGPWLRLEPSGPHNFRLRKIQILLGHHLISHFFVFLSRTVKKIQEKDGGFSKILV